MKKVNETTFIVFLIALTTTCFSQKISAGIDLPGLRYQIYGASLRIDPFNGVYIESFASYRPMKTREVNSLIGFVEREGTVVDLSGGYQKRWSSGLSSYTLSFGPYLQRKNFVRGLLVDRPGVNHIRIKVVGLRLGLSHTFRNGIHLQLKGGVGKTMDRPTSEEVHGANRVHYLNISQEEYYAHGRVILGWQFDWSRNREKM